jgi:hypothetical protein
MKFKSLFLDSVASKWIKKKDQADALKAIGNRVDWKMGAIKCQNKITVEYKFWVMKDQSDVREARLRDLTKDVAFMNSIENKQNLTVEELYKLQQLKFKYGVE